MTEPLLRLNGVTKSFGGITALKDVSLTVTRGEIGGLIGRILLAVLLLFVSSRWLLRLFLIPGMILYPITFFGLVQGEYALFAVAIQLGDAAPDEIAAHLHDVLDVRLGALRAFEQLSQPLESDPGREFPDDDPAFDDDRDRGQGHAHGGDADLGLRIGLVADQPVVRVGLVQVVQDRGPL